MRGAERGVVLLEAMVALAILAIAGTAAVSLTADALRAEHEAGVREAALHDADRLLTALTLLTRTDLDRRLGRHRTGGMVAEIQRPEPTLYRIAVSEARAPAVELLVTVVYRPEPEPR